MDCDGPRPEAFPEGELGLDELVEAEDEVVLGLVTHDLGQALDSGLSPCGRLEHEAEAFFPAMICGELASVELKEGLQAGDGVAEIVEEDTGHLPEAVLPLLIGDLGFELGLVAHVEPHAFVGVGLPVVVAEGLPDFKDMVEDFAGVVDDAKTL